ncbi:MAG TPA: hypothetical protein VGE62_04075 [Candidatus Paceibacterota bacterium]
METKFQTSFIPKQPLNVDAPHRTSSASIFFLISFIIFMASAASAGGVIIYGRIIEQNIKNGNEQLLINKNAFDPNTIKEITRLNDRINAANTLLKQHKGVSTVFQILSNTTLRNVRFTDFNYSSADDKITLSMRGTATGYDTVALQAKAFTDPALKNVFRSPIFGDLNLDQQGNVGFSFTTGVDPFLVDYYKLKREEYGLSGGTAGTQPAVGQVQNQVNGFQQTGAPASEQTSVGAPETSLLELNSGDITNPTN